MAPTWTRRQSGCAISIEKAVTPVKSSVPAEEAIPRPSIFHQLHSSALAQHMGSPLGALLVLVGLKTLIDLFSHWLEHKKFRGGPHARLSV
jgi:hypothetical protein